MKVCITFKTPDAVNDAIDEAMGANQDEFKEEDDYITNHHKITEMIKKFVKFGELITVEFDIEAGTATVLPVRR